MLILVSPLLNSIGLLSSSVKFMLSSKKESFKSPWNKQRVSLNLLVHFIEPLNSLNSAYSLLYDKTFQITGHEHQA